MSLDYGMKNGSIGKGVAGHRCPDSATLWQTLAGEIEGADRARIVDHVFECASCRAKWRMAQRMGAERSLPFVSVVWQLLQRDGHAVATWGLKGLRRLAAAGSGRKAIPILATVALVALGISVLWFPGGPGQKGVGSDQDVSAVRLGSEDGAIIESRISPDDVQSRDNCVLRWSGPSDVLFDLEVRTEDLELVYEAFGLREMRHRIPPEKLKGFEGETTLLWRVNPRPSLQDLESRTFSVRVQ